MKNCFPNGSNQFLIFYHINQPNPSLIITFICWLTELYLFVSTSQLQELLKTFCNPTDTCRNYIDCEYPVTIYVHLPSGNACTS